MWRSQRRRRTLSTVCVSCYGRPRGHIARHDIGCYTRCPCDMVWSNCSCYGNKQLMANVCSPSFCCLLSADPPRYATVPCFVSSLLAWSLRCWPDLDGRRTTYYWRELTELHTSCEEQRARLTTPAHIAAHIYIQATPPARQCSTASCVASSRHTYTHY